MPRLLWLLVFASSFLSAQTLLHTTDAPTRALGGSGVAREGSAALWTNPAGLAYTEAFNGSATVEQRFGLADLRLTSLAAALPGGYGLRLVHYGYAGYGDTGLSGLYGRQLSEKLALGIHLGGRVVRLPQAENRAQLTAGLGLSYRLTPSLALGAVWQPAFGDLSGTRIGGGLRYTVAAQLALNAELHYATGPGVTTRLGLAYLPAEEVAIRLGLNTEVGEVTGGLGYRVAPRLELAVTAAYHQQLGLSPVAGIVLHPR